MLLKRLIKTRYNLYPYKVYQIDKEYVAELNDKEVFRTKHQHLCTSECLQLLAKQRNLINEAKIQNINNLKAQGII